MLPDKKIAEISQETRHIDFVAVIYSYINCKDTCFYCGEKLTAENHTKDHVVPRKIAHKSTSRNFRRSQKCIL